MIGIIYIYIKKKKKVDNFSLINQISELTYVPIWFYMYLIFLT